MLLAPLPLPLFLFVIDLPADRFMQLFSRDFEAYFMKEKLTNVFNF
jgi:hypothetical protein